METVEKLKEVLKCIVKHIRPDGEFYYFTYTEVEEMKNYLKSEKIEDGTVEVVIRIPKEEYDYIQLYGSIKPFSAKQIINGTVLPKGHGRLIDADAINIHDVSPAYGMEVYGVTQDDIEYEPTVIETDKEAEDETK